MNNLSIDYAVVLCPDETRILIWVWEGQIRTTETSSNDFQMEPRFAILRDIAYPIDAQKV